MSKHVLSKSYNIVLKTNEANDDKGQSGDWRVERFEVSAEDEKFGRLRAIATGRGRFVPKGRYTRLMRNDTLVATDAPDEIRDHRFAVYRAQGQVLINGLGLGVTLQAILERPEVDRVTVIEISPDVIALVGPHYKERFGDRLEIVEADAFAWKPPRGVRYSVVWHDIWDNICSDNLPQMHKLHRKYGRRADWQGSWCRRECEEQRRYLG